MIKTTKTLVEQFAVARRTSTPLINVRTADPANVAARLTKAAGDAAVVQWDASAGFNARTKAGNAAIAEMCGKDPLVLNAADAVYMMRKAPAGAVILLFNAHRVWQDITTAQGIWNLRDGFKADQRTLVLTTTPEAKLPRELEGDVIVMEDTLPDADQYAAIIASQCKNSVPALPMPDAKTMGKATDALRGLSPFVAEQLVALSLTRKGVNTSELWMHKKTVINETPGAKVYEGPERFDTIGGHGGLKENLRREINGKRPIKVVAIFDEIEKMTAGAASEHVGDGGVAKDAQQVLLTNMQDRGYRGIVMFGHPGAGKTVVAKALGNEADCIVIQIDMGAAKGSHVGESEARVRALFNMLNEIAGDGGVFVVATCNSTGAITTEMRRRFKSGFYFVDLPDRAEKDSIWKIKMAHYGIAAQALPNDTDWTGAEIENCCEKADDYGCTLIDAAKMIVPVAKQQPTLIDARRREAHGGMLSAHTGETYQMPGAVVDAAQDAPAVVTSRARRTVLES